MIALGVAGPLVLLSILLGAGPVYCSPTKQHRVSKEQALSVAVAVRDQARQPKWHGQGDVAVRVEIDRWRIVLPLNAGRPQMRLQARVVGGICREWAFAETNLLDHRGKETAQGGASLYKLAKVGKKRVWRFKAADEGVGIPESAIKRLKVPQDVIRALGIEILRGA
jgi:hypothetical protein